ncbi:CopK family periplasmic copper-binding protein [Herbaspirillum sp. ST 5-3]|uniref:CopK family periplasmic copper-binding protein n=1 Tax=Oxalobacteraceae TaxID=75682 RepID=UPI0010A36BBF|nr:CopK family periplasmic copper-binding protein [Herbaspirillum sp. ST 5-3]
MLKKIAVVIAGGVVAVSAFAWDDGGIEKSIELKDGSTVHVFKDGKMGMENPYGLVTSMDEGHTMVTKDGKTIVMKGNETARLSLALRPEYRGG